MRGGIVMRIHQVFIDDGFLNKLIMYEKGGIDEVIYFGAGI
jgi:hypothetical protein